MENFVRAAALSNRQFLPIFYTAKLTTDMLVLISQEMVVASSKPLKTKADANKRV